MVNYLFITFTYPFQTVAGLLAAASAEPFYGYHQQAWPAAYGPGFSRTCYGCRGKRDADAEPGYGSTLGVHPGHAVSYSNRSPQGAYGYGFHYGKRSADAEPGYGYGGGYIIQSRGFGGAPGSLGHFNGVHPAGHLNTFAHPVGKRSADADAYGYGYAGGYIRQSRVHPTYGGLIHGGFAHPVGKRDAEAEPGFGYGSTLGVHPGHAVSYSNRSPQGAYGFGRYGKRSAEPGYGYGGGYIIQSRGFGGAPGSFGHFNGVHPAGHLNTFAHPVGKRSAEPGYGLGYGGHYGGGVSYTQRSPQGLGAHRGYLWG